MILLFDIDGTLLLTGGAGARAMRGAFEAVFGVRGGMDRLTMAGRTDSFLLSAALGRAGLPDDDEAHARFRAAYVARLAVELDQPGEGRRGLMPGVEALLDATAAGPDLHAGLLTGNYREAARLKLARFGLEGRFDWGAFGDDARDRHALLPIALARAAQAGVPGPDSPSAVVVIGDTPHDVSCGRASGARVLAVATGPASADELAAAGADLVLPDLRDTTRVLAWLRGR